MDTAIVDALIQAGVAGIVIILILTGALDPGWVRKKNEKRIAYLEEALALERQRNGEMASTTGVTNQLIGALVDLAGERRSRKRDPPEPAGEGERPGLNWKDLT